MVSRKHFIVSNYRLLGQAGSNTGNDTPDGGSNDSGGFGIRITVSIGYNSIFHRLDQLPEHGK